MKRIVSISFAVAMVVLALEVGRLSAGSPDAPGGPTSPGAQMYTTDQIYQRLISGTTGITMTSFTEPATAPGTPSMHSLNDIMAVAPISNNVNGVTRNFVLTGTTFWGLTSGQWGPQTGSLPAGTDVVGPNGQLSFPIPEGIYFQKHVANVVFPLPSATANDTNLTPGNILNGVSIFGVAGTAPPGAPGKTGQTSCWDGAGNPISCTGLPVDGSQQRGVTAPNPRFVVAGPGPLEGPGTVTDRLTGLIWMQDANCFLAPQTWAQAINLVIQINNHDTCGVPFNQFQGADWRLPNVKELFTLTDFGRDSPALVPGAPFTNFQNGRYWTSTNVEVAGQTQNAWNIDFTVGTVNRNQPKTDKYNVLAVRGGQ
jgi:hypothetical protein